jgi:hypothetical protein
MIGVNNLLTYLEAHRHLLVAVKINRVIPPTLVGLLEHP